MINNKLLTYKWIHPFRSKKELEEQGFRYSYHYKGYVKQFSVCRDKKWTTLEGIFIVQENEEKPGFFNDEVQIDVHDEMGVLYAPFYYYNEGYKEFIEEINKKIIQNCKECGIKRMKKDKHGKTTKI